VSLAITQCYFPPDTREHLTVSVLTSARHAGTRLTYNLTRREGRLSWPWAVVWQ